jgi:hypothetical protein
LVEVFLPGHQALPYWTLAASAGLNYQFLVGRIAAAPVAAGARSRWHNIDIDRGLLQERITKLL